MDVTAPLASSIPVHCAHHAIVSVHELKPRPGNPNQHPDSQIVLYAAAIKARGWREAITVSRQSGFIVKGHGGLLAARKLGVDLVPVEYQDYASEDEELADLLAHNRLPELSRTDRDALKSLLTQLEQTGKSYSAGYSADVVASILAEITTRRRLFVQAVRGRRKIVWPEPSHQPAGTGDAEMFTLRKQWVAAREIIDWSLKGGSIYDRKKPLSEKTMQRIMTGLEKFGLKPFFVQPGHGDHPGRKQPRINSIDFPIGTIPASNRFGLAQPFLVELRGTSERQLNCTARSVDKPLPAITAGGGHIGVVEPFIIGCEHTGANGCEVRSVGEPLSTISAHARKGIAQPFLVQVNHGNDGKRATNKRRARPISEPLPTVCGSRGEWALCYPALLPQQSAGVLRSVAEPAPTVATSGAIGLVEPYLIKFYGTAGAQSVAEPLDTVTTKDRHALVRPQVVIDGERYLLDIRFRMLQPHELAGAQGFPRDYIFTGNKTDQVKLIGNAVPRRLARALVYAALSQCSDLTGL